MSTSDFSPGHRALPRIFANPKESQLAEITQLLFQSGSKSYVQSACVREGKLTVTGGLTCDGFPRPAIGKIPYAIWILARDVVRRSKFNKRSDRIAGNLTQQASGGMVPGQLRNHGAASQ